MGIFDRLFGDEAQRKTQARRDYIRNEQVVMQTDKPTIKSRASNYLRQVYESRPNVNRVIRSKQLQRRPNERIVRAARVIIPGGRAIRQTQKSQSKKGYAGRGRPRGPTGKYISPYTGKPIGVYEYRREISQYNQMQKMKAQQQYAQAYQEYQENGQVPVQYRQVQVVQAQAQAQPQPTPQPQGINLTGGFDLLNVGMNKTVNAPTKSVWDVDTPMDNGDYYTEPDFLSGKQVLRRRVREGPKW